MPTQNIITAQNASLPEFHHEKARELHAVAVSGGGGAPPMVTRSGVTQWASPGPRWWPPHNGRIKSPGGYQTEFTKDIAGQMSQRNEFIGREEMKINVPVLVSRCNVKVNTNCRGIFHNIERRESIYYRFHI